MRRGITIVTALALTAIAPSARAFCGFYVSGADAKLFNNATQVVLMREGQRTVLSMQNNYQGPPEDFAMVIPVPVVLQQDNVKTLPRAIFDKVDALTSPRLVEYWEQDPCYEEQMQKERRYARPAKSAVLDSSGGADKKKDLGVKIEAQFTVGEYEIVVLSARDSTGLDTWLRQNRYKIPDAAEPYLKPYVQQGYKFFVAKVNVAKVKFEQIGNGPRMAMLSPLRFHYDADFFNLPIRLGLINSGGTQDLIVNILARGQRYEVSNYDNVAIPTNMDVTSVAKERFGTFYAALFDRTIESHKRAVVTEYSWDASSCDPCPTPPLEDPELATLGADVAIGPEEERSGASFTVTRLHARYGKDALGDDLFFRAAPPVVGGREFVSDEGGKLEQGAKPSDTNNFQARYAIRHPWTGPIRCRTPQRNVWGGPPNGNDPGTLPASKIAFAPRGGLELSAVVKGAIPPDVVLAAAGPTPFIALPGAPDPDAGSIGDVDASSATPPKLPPKGGCAGCEVGTGELASSGILAGLFAFVAAAVRRRRGRR